MSQPSLNNFPGHTRPAQLGDLCVLLEPKPEEQRQLRTYQHALQERFGGTPIEWVHLTCQRFGEQSPQQVAQCAAALEQVVAKFAPFVLSAIGLDTLYLPIRETNILKWQVELTVELRGLLREISTALEGLGIELHYLPSFLPDLVAALQDVPALDQAALQQTDGFPHPLFTTGQLVISRIQGPSSFEIEAIIPWPDSR